MAGHSQFKNIMHRKGAQDAKRAKVFTKIIRELTVAARGNPDPSNPPPASHRLRRPRRSGDKAPVDGAAREDEPLARSAACIDFHT